LGIIILFDGSGFKINFRLIIGLFNIDDLVDLTDLTDLIDFSDSVSLLSELKSNFSA
jgi:hypothetical protein